MGQSFPSKWERKITIIFENPNTLSKYTKKIPLDFVLLTISYRYKRENQINTA
jgi:hypothetical protein